MKTKILNYSTTVLLGFLFAAFIFFFCSCSNHEKIDYEYKIDSLQFKLDSTRVTLLEFRVFYAFERRIYDSLLKECFYAKMVNDTIYVYEIKNPV